VNSIGCLSIGQAFHELQKRHQDETQRGFRRLALDWEKIREIAIMAEQP
jgi:hypothetical protein